MIPRQCRKILETAISNWAKDNNIKVQFENVSSPGTSSPPYVLCLLRNAFHYSGNIEGTRYVVDGNILLNVYSTRGDGMGQATNIIESFSNTFHMNKVVGKGLRIVHPLAERAIYYEESGLAITPTFTRFKFEYTRQ